MLCSSCPLSDERAILSPLPTIGQEKISIACANGPISSAMLQWWIEDSIGRALLEWLSIGRQSTGQLPSLEGLEPRTNQQYHQPQHKFLHGTMRLEWASRECFSMLRSWKMSCPRQWIPCRSWRWESLHQQCQSFGQCIDLQSRPMQGMPGWRIHNAPNTRRVSIRAQICCGQAIPIACRTEWFSNAIWRPAGNMP